MAPTQADGGSAPDPAAGGEGQPDAPEQWGDRGMVGEGRYRLTRRLGRGGMAEVFAAEDIRLGRTVAVKLLRSDLAADPVSKARFTREAQAVAGLNHHAVVSVYDSGEDTLANGDTVPFIVMELVEGRTIRELLLNADAPPVEQALLIISGVLEALAYSHQHGIVHRDIKPANVIITSTGAVKVMDFGIARALHGASTTMTQTGMVMGTPQYLSPEQALGRAVDARSDLYATGCMLYELLALRPPFTGETPLSVVYQHVQDDPRIPSEISERVPPELDGLVLRSLAKEPDDRYQSAEEMRGEIQYALRMLSSEGTGTGTWATGHIGATPPMGGPVVGGPRDSGTGTPPQGTPTQAGPPFVIGTASSGRGTGPSSAPRRGLRKAALLVAAAVVAVSAGIFAAVNGSLNADSNHTPEKKTSTTPPPKNKDKDSGTPEQPEDSSSPGTSDDGGTWNHPGGGGQSSPGYPSWSESGSESAPSNGDGGQESESASQPPPDGDGESESPPPADGGTEDGGTATEGQDDGGTTEGTEGTGTEDAGATQGGGSTETTGQDGGNTGA